jgi:ribosome biogenesis GTPase A
MGLLSLCPRASPRVLRALATAGAPLPRLQPRGATGSLAAAFHSSPLLAATGPPGRREDSYGGRDNDRAREDGRSGAAAAGRSWGVQERSRDGGGDRDGDEDMEVEFCGEERAPHPSTEALRVQVLSKGGNKTTRVCIGCGADIVPKGGAAAPAEAAPSSAPAPRVGRGVRLPVGSSAGQVGLAHARGGYWAEQKEILKKSKISNWSLCPRCKALQQDSASETETGVEKKWMVGGVTREAFRKEVGKIRNQEHAAVLLAVDAVNVTGTLLRNLREYVGGCPVLLAVTRCDLLPTGAEGGAGAGKGTGKGGAAETRRRMDLFRRAVAEAARELRPAQVFLLSTPGDGREGEAKPATPWPSEVGQLAAAVLQHAEGREVFVVGAANIGKSTLTDALLSELVAQQGQVAFSREGGFLGGKRLTALRERRVTRSALPGTTLQNIRLPCFVDHLVGLWDTPGLLLDESLRHFPLRRFEELLRSKPRPVAAQELSVRPGCTSFVLQLGEEGDSPALPLLRMRVRVKVPRRPPGAGAGAGEGAGAGAAGDNGGEGDASEPVIRLVWNSIFPLKATVFDEKMPPRPPPAPAPAPAAEARSSGDSDSNSNSNSGSAAPRPSKEERQAAYAERVAQEKAEMGFAAWRERERGRAEEAAEELRTRRLSGLSRVGVLEVPRGAATDLAVVNLGWLTVLTSRGAAFEVWAPSSGVRVVPAPAYLRPPHWPADTAEGDRDGNRSGVRGGGSGSGARGGGSDVAAFSAYSAASLWDPRGGRQGDSPDQGPDEEPDEEPVPAADPWLAYSGERVGWEWSDWKEKPGWQPLAGFDAAASAPLPPQEERYAVHYPDKIREIKSGGSSRPQGGGDRGGGRGGDKGGGKGGYKGGGKGGAAGRGGERPSSSSNSSSRRKGPGGDRRGGGAAKSKGKGKGRP